MFGEGPTDDNNGSIGAAEKRFCINFSKTKSCLSLYYSPDLFVTVVICLLTIKTYKLKANNKNVNFSS